MEGGAERSKDAAARIRRYLLRHIILDDGVELTDVTYLLSGLVDSQGLMELVVFLEDEFVIALDFTDLEPRNFSTVGDIAKLVSERAKDAPAE